MSKKEELLLLIDEIICKLDDAESIARDAWIDDETKDDLSYNFSDIKDEVFEISDILSNEEEENDEDSF